MTARFFASTLPLVLFLPACGASLRAGPKASYAHGTGAVQGEATAVAAIGGPEAYLGVPVTIAVGSMPSTGSALVQIDSGLEYARAFEDSPFGFRASARVGGAVTGPSGATVGLRGGPMVALIQRDRLREGESQLVPKLSLEAFGDVGLGGDIGGKPGVGGVLSVGVDFFSRLDMRQRSGRPLRDEDGSWLLAPLCDGPSEPVMDLDLSGISDRERALLGERWLDDARHEHASIASFLELAQELLALGAPDALINSARRAALDEAVHARLAFALASAYRGTFQGPGAIPQRDYPRTPSLEQLAIESVGDGALGEGAAAAVLRARARVARAPLVLATLRRLARDEARHAALGWDVLQFCVNEGGPQVTGSVLEAWDRANAASQAEKEELESAPTGLEHHGHIAKSVERSAFNRARRAVQVRLRRALESAVPSGTR